MSLMLWGSLFLVCLMGAMSPGPSLAVVLRETVRNSRWHGVVAGLSHALGVGLWAFLTVHGLALLVTEHQGLYMASHSIQGPIKVYLFEVRNPNRIFSII